MKYIFEILPFTEGIKLISEVKNQLDSTAYQKVEFLKYYRQSQNFRIIGLRPEVNILHKKFFFISVRDGKNLCCLMPCEFNTKTKNLGFAGDQKQLNVPYYDSKRFNQKMFDELITFCGEYNGVESLFFQNLDKNTLFYNYLSDYCTRLNKETFTESTTKCVSIDNIDDDYDTWFKGLSKSVRQNVRTSYNHLKSDGVKMEVHFQVGGVNCKTARKDMYLQRRRNLEKRGNNLPSWKLKPLCWIGSWLSILNPRVKMLMHSEVSFLCEVWLDGQLAAFVGGYLSSKGRFFIPFLKYNMDFKRYSPGGLAICESIKYLCESEFHLSRYDLLTGDEPYKYSYGGTDYENANIKIRLNRK